MKKIIKILLIVFGIIAALIIIFILYLFRASGQPVVKQSYFKKISSDEPLEQKYTQKGNYEVSYTEYDSDNETYKKYEIWYPSLLESSDLTYPMVIMANGTGVPASKYKAVFEHLASWGFIVVGNEDPNSWDGHSSAAALDFLLNLNTEEGSIFYQKIDIANIGIAGHSQGGVGAVNAVTNHENGQYYKAIYIASATHTALAAALEWPYDISRIHIPCFMTAGTGKADAETIAPLSSLEENYDAISDDVMKVRARRTDIDHGDMLAYADGYMTAWLLYHLQNDEEAGRIFIGEDAEILHNPNWQDIEKNR